jgi:hypothetical protein
MKIVGNVLCLNLYIPSTLNWQEKGVAITPETRFPLEHTP